MSAVDDEEVLVGRCYTKARRHPSMIGQWEGRRLWGGPYTVPQFIAMGVVFAVMILLLVAVPALWATFGLFNLGALVLFPYVASLLVRRLHVDGRSPFAALASTAGLLVGGRRRRLGGRPLRRIAEQSLLGTATLSGRPATTSHPEPAVPARDRARPTAAAPSGIGSAALSQLATRHSTTSRNQR